MTRRLIGNLDGEGELAAGRARGLNQATLAAIAGAATLLRVFGEPDDELWLPATLDPARVFDVPGLPRPRLSATLRTPRKQQPAARAELPWIETPRVARRPDLRLAAGPPGAFWQEPWTLPPVPAAVVAAVHHRGFAQRLAAERGLGLPGAATVANLAELTRHLRVLDHRGPWVVKAPLSAAGRERFVAPHERALSDPAAERRVARLLAHHGPLVFEPWLPRLADYGAVARVLPDGRVEPRSVHRLRVDALGRFQGIELAVGAAAPPELSGGERALLATALTAAGRALAAAGFAGLFGLDAFRYRSPVGEPLFHALGELNARLTFGAVARALVDRLAEPLGWPQGSWWRLSFGFHPAAGAVRLLAPGPAGEAGAWLEPLPIE